VLGPTSGLIDLEEDEEGALAQAISDMGISLPPSATFRSRRGVHIFYRCHEPVRTVRLSPKVELRGLGGYSIIPPSTGREYILGLEHLTDAPAGLISAAQHIGCRPKNRKEAAPITSAPRPTYEGLGPKKMLASGLQPFDIRLTSTAGDDPSGFQIGRWESGIWKAVAQLIGVPDVVNQAFHCPLPGHRESTPSAAWFVFPKGEVLLHDFHRRDGDEYFTVTEVYAAVRSGRVQKLREMVHAVWSRRLLIELGLVMPILIPDPPMLERMRRSTQAVWQGFSLLVSTRWCHTHGEPVPYTWQFAADWSGVSKTAAGRALRELLQCGAMQKVREEDGLSFYLPSFSG